jgi:hypothetical protein
VFIGGGAAVVRRWCGGGAAVVRRWCGGGAAVVPLALYVARKFQYLTSHHGKLTPELHHAYRGNSQPVTS